MKIHHLFWGICLCFSTNILFAQNYQKTSSGIKTTVNAVDIEVQFFAPAVARVIKSPEGVAYEKQSLSVIAKPEKVSFKADIQDNKIVLNTSELSVSVDTGTGIVSYFSKDGKSLLAEKSGMQFINFDDAGTKTYQVYQPFILDKEEAIYGLGQLQNGKMIQRNMTKNLIQGNVEDVSPFFQSTKGYGVFWDNYSPTLFTDNEVETSFRSEVGDCVDYYFMYGKNADGVIAQVRSLTGQAPMFPLWTYGYWQSKERYKSQEEVVDVVRKYRELGVPLDGIIQDWQYWGPNSNWNSMNFDNPEFPDPQKMIDHVKKKNAKIMISIWASFGPDTNPYKDLEKINALFNFKTWPADGGVKAYDAYNEKARDIYWEHLNKGLFSKGIDAWWTDSTEPDHLDVQERDFDIPTAMGTYRSVVNAFPLMSNKGVYEHQRAVTSNKRVYLLTRCAFAGQQRYAANTWSGDVMCNWETFRKQIPTGLNFSLSGIPYWNTDIGGFFAWPYHGGAENKAYHELYTRWFQYGTFLPMQRSHGSGVKKEIYNLGKKGDWVYDSEEKYINLRYALLPYLYSTGWQVTDNAGSFLRALFMDFNEDQKVHTISNQYMFGKAFLVTPVTRNMYVFSDKEQWKDPYEDFSKTGTQDVYLPKGTKWFDFWTGEALNGGQVVTKEVPIDIIPLYVRAGSIVPFGPKVQYSTEKKWNNLEIRIYPGADGEFVLYEDENDNYNYEKGAYSTIKFTWDDANRTLNIADREGTFPGMLKSRKFNIVVVDKENGTGSIQSTKFTKSVSYGGKKKSVKL